MTIFGHLIKEPVGGHFFTKILILSIRYREDLEVAQTINSRLGYKISLPINPCWLD